MLSIISSTALDALADDECFLKCASDEVIAEVVQVIWLAEIDYLNDWLMILPTFLCIQDALDIYRRYDTHGGTRIMSVTFTPSENTINFQTAGKTVSLKTRHVRRLASMAPHH
ncbi:MAG: hypothetical protein WCV69_04450 [Patescibacteria group bacterium]|jgi:hypothetical protein